MNSVSLPPLQSLKELLSVQGFVPPDRFTAYINAQRLRTVRGFERLLAMENLPGTSLFPHQRKAVLTVLREMRGKAILADEVGLGKTIEAGAILSEYLVRGLVKRVLVIAPASLVGQWREELGSKFGLSFHPGLPAGERRIPDRLLLSLDTAKRPPYRELLCESEWDMVIVDEAHRLKNPRTANYRLVRNLHAKFLLLLTATPVQNNLKELYHLVDLVRPGQFTTWRSFRKRFVKGPQEPLDVEELRKLLGETMVRNVRVNTLIRFPKRQVTPVVVRMPPQYARAYRALLEYSRKLYRRGERSQKLLPVTLLKEAVSSPEAVVGTLQRLKDRRAPACPECESPLDAFSALVAGSGEGAEGGEGGVGINPKMGALLKLIQREGKKCLVYTEYLSTMRAISKALRHVGGISVWEYHGSLPRNSREDTIKAFEFAPTGIMVSTDSGSEGLNLQFCDVVIDFDFPWNPMKVEQRIGRVHRLGRSKPVAVYNLVLGGTVEESILKLLTRKLRMFEIVIGELDSVLGDLDGAAVAKRFELAVLESESDEELNRRLEHIGREFEELRAKYAEARSVTASIIDTALVRGE